MYVSVTFVAPDGSGRVETQILAEPFGPESLIGIVKDLIGATGPRASIPVGIFIGLRGKPEHVTPPEDALRLGIPPEESQP